MIRCNNCMSTFQTDQDLSKILETQEFYEGDWHTTSRSIYCPENPLIENEDRRDEVFNGCPYCLSDSCLMDLKPYENLEEGEKNYEEGT